MNDATAQAVLMLNNRPALSSRMRKIFRQGMYLVRRDAGEVDLSESCDIDPVETATCLKEQVSLGTGMAPDAVCIAYNDPFRFWHVSGMLPASKHHALKMWLEQREAWQPVDGGFYCADVFGITDDRHVPATLHGCLGRAGHAWLEAFASRLFGELMQLHGPIVLHRMQDGQGVGIHSDHPLAGEETHRIVLTVCRQQQSGVGGHFVLLGGTHPQDARALIPLHGNNAIAFRLDDVSYHAVTSVRAGRRFSVVMSFRRHADGKGQDKDDRDVI